MLSLTSMYNFEILLQYMDKKISVWKNVVTIIIILLLLSSTYYLGFLNGKKVNPDLSQISTIINKDTGKPDNVDFSMFWKAWQTLNEKYVATHHASTTPTDLDRVYGAIKGMTAALGDPYTVFFPPEESQIFESEISGNFEGIGMEVGIKDNILTVISALPGTPAERGGVKSGDKIIKINESVTSGMAVDQAVKIIRGKKGTDITLTLLRVGTEKPIELKLTRDVIDIPTIKTETKQGVFIIHLFSFTADSPSLFRNALRQFIMSKSDRLVLDLRGNPGGYLEAAVDMASWFLPPGKPVVREDYGSGKPEDVSRSKGYNIFNGSLKMVILVDGGSASAAEILSGALSEYNIATLIGTRTFGKGSVQELVKLTPDTNLKVTIARWLTPNGLSISDGGLTPAVEVKITEDDVKAGKDPQMDKAIEYLLNK